MAQKIVNKTLSEGMIGEFVDASPRRTFKDKVNTRDIGHYGAALFKQNGEWTVTDSPVVNAPIAFSVNPKEDCLVNLRGMNSDEGRFAPQMNGGKCECAICTMGRIWLGIAFMKADEEGGIAPITDLDEAREANIVGFIVAQGAVIAVTGDGFPEGQTPTNINGFNINRIHALDTDAGLYLCEVEIANPVYVEVGTEAEDGE